jgi:hypothetical protein
MVSEVLLETGRVLTTNVAVVAFAATATLAGIWAAAVLLLDRATIAPPVGAGPLKVTVPVEDVPPGTVAGFRDTEARTAAGEPPYTAW